MALKKILVVEDSVDLAELTQRILEHIGLTSVVATTGMSALRKVQEEKPDLILLDLILPDISGLKVGVRLKAGFRHAPFQFWRSLACQSAGRRVWKTASVVILSNHFRSTS